MKKMFLSAFAVVAIVGTGLAIDAEGSHSIWCSANEGSQPAALCTEQVPFRSLEGEEEVGLRYCNQLENQNCETQKMIYQAD